MCWVRTASLALALLASISARSAAADAPCHAQRLALVIGNSAYTDRDAPLREPIGDAREFADALQRLGFATTEAENLTGDRMRSLIDEFEQKVTSDAVALVFFSGFGLQSGGHTYLIPVDATIWNEQDIKTVGINLDRILSDVASRGARLRLVIVDGARHNPYERRFRPTGSMGMAAVNGTPGLLALYSSLPGTTFDESGGNTSPFVDALITAIGKPGAKAEEAFRRARAEASRVYRGSQTPWVSSFLDEDLPLAGGECRTAQPATAEAAPPAPPPPSVAATPASTQTASAPAPQKSPPPRPAPPVKIPARPVSPVGPPPVIATADAPPLAVTPPPPTTVVDSPPRSQPVAAAPSPPPQPVAAAPPPPPQPVAVASLPSQPAPSSPTPAPLPSPASPEIVKTQPTAQVAATPTPPPAAEQPPPSPASPPHAPEQVAVQPRPLPAPTPVPPEPLAVPKPAPRQEVAIAIPPPPVPEDPGADDRITDTARLKEIADRLFDRDYNPGEPGSADMRIAVLDYEKLAGLPLAEYPTVRLLSNLRTVPAPTPWGAIAISKDHEKVGTSWNEDTRRAALSDARAHCGPDCVAAKGFYGHQCAALAKSPVGWSIASGDDATQAQEAALAKCNQFGSVCEIRRALCADGSGRVSPTKTP